MVPVTDNVHGTILSLEQDILRAAFNGSPKTAKQVALLVNARILTDSRESLRPWTVTVKY